MGNDHFESQGSVKQRVLTRAVPRLVGPGPYGLTGDKRPQTPKAPKSDALREPKPAGLT